MKIQLASSVARPALHSSDNQDTARKSQVVRRKLEMSHPVYVQAAYLIWKYTLQPSDLNNHGQRRARV